MYRKYSKMIYCLLNRWLLKDKSTLGILVCLLHCLEAALEFLLGAMSLFFLTNKNVGPWWGEKTVLFGVFDFETNFDMNSDFDWFSRHFSTWKLIYLNKIKYIFVRDIRSDMSVFCYVYFVFQKGMLFIARYTYLI